ncbi:MAG: hypothetical protein LBI05_00550, partial [Planctomycetaceae bacterium]|nr:hypothetical protein [Planctomycetaceae bacterium]
MRLAVKTLFLLLLLFPLFVSLVAAQVEMTHQTWQSSDFGAMAEPIRAQHDLNLLAFPGAKLARSTDADSTYALTDGEIGAYGGDGRVAMHGNPSTLIYYLGKPRPIQEIRLYSGNIDSRGHQDFEIRLANNAGNPGIIPAFPAEPTFSSGDKILGAGSGGFMSRIADKSGKPLSGDQKYDWIEFKIWRTYPSNVGDAAKSQSRANGWSAFIELQVLGDPNDPALFNSEAERQAWLNTRAAIRFQKTLSDQVGEDVMSALQHPESLKRAIDDLTKKY